MKIDTHIHTSLSDGYYDTDLVAKLASAANLDFLVCTDHDIINKQAKKLFEEQCINTCEGVELSIRDEKLNRFVHITSYSKAFSSRIDDILNEVISDKFDILLKLIETLTPLGFQIDSVAFKAYYEDNKAYINELGLSFLGRFIFDVQHNVELAEKLSGKSISRKKFLQTYLSPENNEQAKKILQNIQRPNMLVELANDNDNPKILSFAHPNFTVNKDIFEETLLRYMNAGINAVEVNAKAERHWVNTILEFQKKYDYIITFGSDCHFVQYEETHHGTLGEMNRFLDEKTISSNFKRFRDYLG